MKTDSRTGFTDALKRKILERDRYTCQYCGCKAEAVDHVLPWSYIPNNHPSNLVAACNYCNGRASDLVFDDFEAKKKYLLKKFGTHVVIWTDEELDELGPSLRKRIEASALICNTHSEALHLCAFLEERGFKPKYDP